MSLYVVCENLQRKEIDEYCFKKCGKILIGGISFNNLYWSPCRIKDCPCLDREQSVGEVDLEVLGKEDLVLRKLKPILAGRPNEEKLVA